MIIYLITNTITGKKYVGMTVNTARRRFLGHCRSAANNPRVPLHLAIAKYGPESFTIRVLAHASNRKQLGILERQFIEKLNCRTPRGYNLTAGGDGYSGAPVSEETRQRLGRRSKDAWARLTPEERAERGNRISAAKKGKAQPWAKTNGNRLRGRKRSQDFRDKVSIGMKRYVSKLHQDEMSRRAKCRIPKKGYKLALTPEQRRRRSKAARLGALKRYSDPEQRRLTSERTRAQHARKRAQRTLVFVG